MTHSSQWLQWLRRPFAFMQAATPSNNPLRKAPHLLQKRFDRFDMAGAIHRQLYRQPAYAQLTMAEWLGDKKPPFTKLVRHYHAEACGQWRRQTWFNHYTGLLNRLGIGEQPAAPAILTTSILHYRHDGEYHYTQLSTVEQNHVRQSGKPMALGSWTLGFTRPWQLPKMVGTFIFNLTTAVFADVGSALAWLCQVIGFVVLGSSLLSLFTNTLAWIFRPLGWFVAAPLRLLTMPVHLLPRFIGKSIGYCFRFCSKNVKWIFTPLTNFFTFLLFQFLLENFLGLLSPWIRRLENLLIRYFPILKQPLHINHLLKASWFKTAAFAVFQAIGVVLMAPVVLSFYTTTYFKALAKAMYHAWFVKSTARTMATIWTQKCQSMVSDTTVLSHGDVIIDRQTPVTMLALRYAEHSYFYEVEQKGLNKFSLLTVPPDIFTAQKPLPAHLPAAKLSDLQAPSLQALCQQLSEWLTQAPPDLLHLHPTAQVSSRCTNELEHYLGKIKPNDLANSKVFTLQLETDLALLRHLGDDFLPSLHLSDLRPLLSQYANKHVFEATHLPAQVAFAQINQHLQQRNPVWLKNCWGYLGIEKHGHDDYQISLVVTKMDVSEQTVEYFMPGYVSRHGRRIQYQNPALRLLLPKKALFSKQNGATDWLLQLLQQWQCPQPSASEVEGIFCYIKTCHKQTKRPTEALSESARSIYKPVDSVFPSDDMALLHAYVCASHRFKKLKLALHVLHQLRRQHCHFPVGLQALRYRCQKLIESGVHTTLLDEVAFYFPQLTNALASSTNTEIFLPIVSKKAARSQPNVAMAKPRQKVQLVKSALRGITQVNNFSYVDDTVLLSDHFVQRCLPIYMAINQYDDDVCSNKSSANHATKLLRCLCTISDQLKKIQQQQDFNKLTNSQFSQFNAYLPELLSHLDLNQWLDVSNNNPLHALTPEQTRLLMDSIHTIVHAAARTQLSRFGARTHYRGQKFIKEALASAEKNSTRAKGFMKIAVAATDHARDITKGGLFDPFISNLDFTNLCHHYIPALFTLLAIADRALRAYYPQAFKHTYIGWQDRLKYHSTGGFHYHSFCQLIIGNQQSPEAPDNALHQLRLDGYFGNFHPSGLSEKYAQMAYYFCQWDKPGQQKVYLDHGYDILHVNSLAQLSRLSSSVVSAIKSVDQEKIKKNIIKDIRTNHLVSHLESHSELKPEATIYSPQFFIIPASEVISCGAPPTALNQLGSACFEEVLKAHPDKIANLRDSKAVPLYTGNPDNLIEYHHAPLLALHQEAKHTHEPFALMTEMFQLITKLCSPYAINREIINRRHWAEPHIGLPLYRQENDDKIYLDKTKITGDYCPTDAMFTEIGSLGKIVHIGSEAGSNQQRKDDAIVVTQRAASSYQENNVWSKILHSELSPIKTSSFHRHCERMQLFNKNDSDIFSSFRLLHQSSYYHFFRQAGRIYPHALFGKLMTMLTKDCSLLKDYEMLLLLQRALWLPCALENDSDFFPAPLPSHCHGVLSLPSWQVGLKREKGYLRLMEKLIHQAYAHFSQEDHKNLAVLLFIDRISEQLADDIQARNLEHRLRPAVLESLLPSLWDQVKQRQLDQDTSVYAMIASLWLKRFGKAALAQKNNENILADVRLALQYAKLLPQIITIKNKKYSHTYKSDQIFDTSALLANFLDIKSQVLLQHLDKTPQTASTPVAKSLPTLPELLAQCLPVSHAWVLDKLSWEIQPSTSAEHIWQCKLTETVYYQLFLQNIPEAKLSLQRQSRSHTAKQIALDWQTLPDCFLDHLQAQHSLSEWLTWQTTEANGNTILITDSQEKLAYEIYPNLVQAHHRPITWLSLEDCIAQGQHLACQQPALMAIASFCQQAVESNESVWVTLTEHSQNVVDKHMDCQVHLPCYPFTLNIDSTGTAFLAEDPDWQLSWVNTAWFGDSHALVCKSAHHHRWMVLPPLQQPTNPAETGLCFYVNAETPSDVCTWEYANFASLVGVIRWLLSLSNQPLSSHMVLLCQHATVNHLRLGQSDAREFLNLQNVLQKDQWLLNMHIAACGCRAITSGWDCTDTQDAYGDFREQVALLIADNYLNYLHRFGSIAPNMRLDETGELGICQFLASQQRLNTDWAKHCTKLLLQAESRQRFLQGKGRRSLLPLAVAKNKTPLLHQASLESIGVGMEVIDAIAKAYPQEGIKSSYQAIVFGCQATSLSYQILLSQRHALIAIVRKSAEGIVNNISNAYQPNSIPAPLSEQGVCHISRMALAKRCKLPNTLESICEQLKNKLGITLRDEQRDKLNYLTQPCPDKKGRLLQLPMGFGKTKVLLPVLTCFYAAQGQLPVLILPPELVKVQLKDLTHTTLQAFGQHGYLFDFNGHSDVNPLELTRQLELLEMCLNNQAYIVTTPQHMHVFFNAYHEFQDSMRKQAFKGEHLVLLEKFSKIAAVFKTQSVAILDEVDTALDVRTEVNLTLQQGVKVDSCYLGCIAKLYERLSSYTFDSGIQMLTWFAQGEQSSYDLLPNDEKKRLTEYLGNEIVMEWPSFALLSAAQKQQLHHYVCNQAAPLPPFLEQQNQALLHLVCLIKQELLVYLPATLGKRGGCHYGLDPERSIDYAVPYRLGTVVPRADFGLPWETINFTYQTYLHDNLGALDLANLARNINELQQQILAADLEDSSDAPASMLQVWYDFLAAAPDLLQQETYFDELKHWFDGSENCKQPMPTPLLEKLLVYLQQDWRFKLQYVRYLVLSQLVILPEKISSSSHHLVDMFSQVHGFSGTMANQMTFPSSLLPDPHPIDVADSIDQAYSTWQQRFDQQWIVACPDNAPLTLLETFTTRHAAASKQLHALIDVGGLLKEASNDTIAQALRTFWQRPSSHIDSILYFSESCGGKLCILPVNSAKPAVSIDGSGNEVIGTTLQRLGLQPQNMFTYYDFAHVVGTDIAQPPGCCALVTVGNKTLLRDVEQGSMRMRQFGTEPHQQQCFLILPATFYEYLEKEGVPNWQQLKDFLIANQNHKLGGDLLVAFRQAVAQWVQHQIKDLQRQCDPIIGKKLFIAFRSFFVQISPLHCQHLQPMKVRAALEGYIARTQAQLQTALHTLQGDLPPAVMQRLQALHNELGKGVDHWQALLKPSMKFELLPQEIFDTPQNRETIQIVQTQREQQTEQEQEMEQEMELQSHMQQTRLLKPYQADPIDFHMAQAAGKCIDLTQLQRSALFKQLIPLRKVFGDVFDANLYVSENQAYLLRNGQSSLGTFLQKPCFYFLQIAAPTSGQTLFVAVSEADANALCKEFIAIQPEPTPWQITLCTMAGDWLHEITLSDAFERFAQARMTAMVQLKLSQFNPRANLVGFSKQELEYLEKWVYEDSANLARTEQRQVFYQRFKRRSILSPQQLDREDPFRVDIHHKHYDMFYFIDQLFNQQGSSVTANGLQAASHR